MSLIFFKQNSFGHKVFRRHAVNRIPEHGLSCLQPTVAARGQAGAPGPWNGILLYRGLSSGGKPAPFAGIAEI